MNFATAFLFVGFSQKN